MTVRIRPLALVALGAAALLLAGCSGSAESAETSAAPIASSEPTAVVTPTAQPTEAEAIEVTCESLLPASVLEEFAAHKWTAKEDVFRVGSLTLTDGVQCVWGDYTVASDHVQIYGWAPITASEADSARGELLAAGWKVVDDASGDYLTENSANVLNPDEDGYGMTYEFGDGWVTIADTKQSLLLIERPA